MGGFFYEAKGQYVCYLDGDDFYTDDRKLQKQADILDADTAHRYGPAATTAAITGKAPAGHSPSKSLSGSVR